MHILLCAFQSGRSFSISHLSIKLNEKSRCGLFSDLKNRMRKKIYTEASNISSHNEIQSGLKRRWARMGVLQRICIGADAAHVVFIKT
jgi:hypothetical protein